MLEEAVEQHLDLSDEPILTKPEDILKNNTQLRQHMVNTMFQNAMTDPKMAKVVLSAMKDSDDQILKVRRLEQDNVNAASDRETAIRIAEQSARLARATGNPFRRQEENSMSSSSDSVQEALPDIEVKPGQTDQGASTETYSEFMSKFDEDGNLIS